MSKAGDRTVLNCYCTIYDVVKKAGRKAMGFKIKEYKEDAKGAIKKGEGGQKLRTEWDISWHDLSITADFLVKMEQY